MVAAGAILVNHADFLAVFLAHAKNAFAGDGENRLSLPGT